MRGKKVILLYRITMWQVTPQKGLYPFSDKNKFNTILTAVQLNFSINYLFLYPFLDENNYESNVDEE